MRKIVRELITAHEEKNLDQFEKSINNYHKKYFIPERQDYDIVMKLLMNIILDENYEYLKSLKEIRPTFELDVINYVMMKMYDDKISVLKELKSKTIESFNYNVEAQLFNMLVSLCEDSYIASEVRLKTNKKNVQKTYGIIPSHTIINIFGKIFWQMNLMIDLIKEDQQYSKPFGGRKGNPWPINNEKSKKNENNFQKFALFRRVADEKFTNRKISDTDLTRLLGMTDREYSTFKAYEIRHPALLEATKNIELSQSDSKKIKKIIFDYLNS